MNTRLTLKIVGYTLASPFLACLVPICAICWVGYGADRAVRHLA